MESSTRHLKNSIERLPSKDKLLLAAVKKGLFIKIESDNFSTPMEDFSEKNCEKRSYSIHAAKLKDIPRLLFIEKKCWISLLRLTRDELICRIKQYPQGQLVVKIKNRIVGVIYTQRISDYDNLSNNITFKNVSRLYDSNGKYLQLIGINILPDMQDRGIGEQLLQFVLQWSSFMEGVEKLVCVTRCKNFSAGSKITLQEYIRRHQESSKGIDPILRFHTSHGAKIIKIIPNYRPHDYENQGAGILIEYDLAKNLNDRSPALKSVFDPNIHKNISDIISSCIQSLLPKQNKKHYSKQRPLREMGIDS